MIGPPHLSASVTTADYGALAGEVARATAAGVDSLHLDVMDGHFVDNITFGPATIAALRPHSELPFHSHLMISRPLRFAERFAEAGSDILVFHVEADDEPDAVIRAIRAAGRSPGLALNPDTPAEAVHPFLDELDLLLVMSVHPGFGGQAFIPEVLPKIGALREEIDRRGLALPIGVDGGVGLGTIGDAYAAGGEVLVTGSALFDAEGEMADAARALREAAAPTAASTS